ncbi:MAG: hypothetical protein E7661_07585 [Ruminococcaceae bacterium]|nr:hypothetical protein [Oscillospiraceae bacterium]
MKTTKQILATLLSLMLLLSVLIACSENSDSTPPLESTQTSDTQQTEAMAETENLIETSEADTSVETEAGASAETEDGTSAGTETGISAETEDDSPAETEAFTSVETEASTSAETETDASEGTEPDTSVEIETDTPEDTVRRTVTREEWVKAFENLEKITNVTVTNSLIQVIEWSDAVEEETLGENEHRLPDHMEILEVRKYDNGALSIAISGKTRDDLSGTPEHIADPEAAYLTIDPENSLEVFNFDAGSDGMLDFISELEEFDHYGYDKFTYSETEKTYSAPVDFYYGDVSLEIGFEDGILSQMIMLQVASFDEGTMTIQIATHITDIGTTEKIAMPIEAVKAEIDVTKEEIPSANCKITWNGPEVDNVNTFVCEFIDQLKLENISECNFISNKLKNLHLEFTDAESIEFGEYTFEYDSVSINFGVGGHMTTFYIKKLETQEQFAIMVDYDTTNS